MGWIKASAFVKDAYDWSAALFHVAVRKLWY